MTTEQTMLALHARSARIALALLLTACMCSVLVGGCAKKDRLVMPTSLAAPYDTSRGDVLWAVVPLRNESGTSTVDVFEASEKVVAAAAQVRGVRVVPLNRTIATMRSLDLNELATPGEARQLAEAMGVDGLILGSITSWNPYDPPQFGLALALFASPGAMQDPMSNLDVRKLRYQPTDYEYFPRTTFKDAPASVVSEFMDGKNQQVQMDIQRYAKGRHDPMSALGWRRYLASMDLFSEFVAWQTVERLLAHESIRLARATLAKGDD